MSNHERNHASDLESRREIDRRSGEVIATFESHPEVVMALACLTTVLADLEHSPLSGDLVCEVADVVSDLIATRPPLPPLDYPEAGADDDEHALALMVAAARWLRVAVLATPSPDERLRAGIAVSRLNELITRWQP